MKANELVKKFGWGKSIELIEFYNRCGSLTCDCDFTYDELKRIVKSHELVVDYYGLARAKEHAESNYTAPELKDALKQAIADVESYQ